VYFTSKKFHNINMATESEPKRQELTPGVLDTSEAPKQKKSRPLFKWDEWLTYHDASGEEEEDEDDDTSDERKQNLRWINCLIEAMMDKRLMLFVSSTIMSVFAPNVTGALFAPMRVSALMLSAYHELHVLLLKGMKTPREAKVNIVPFKAELDGKEQSFILDLIDGRRMTLCLSEEK
jgi:hypothetical protein